MAGIQATNGIVTGIDIQGTVDQLLSLAAAPRTRLTNATKQIQSEQVALTALTALVVGVQLSTDRLGQSSLYSATTASSSSSTTLRATVSGSPKIGSHSFIPVRQASAQQLTSSLLTSRDQLVGAGEVVIQQGGFLDESVRTGPTERRCWRGPRVDTRYRSKWRQTRSSTFGSRKRSTMLSIPSTKPMVYKWLQASMAIG